MIAVRMLKGPMITTKLDPANDGPYTTEEHSAMKLTRSFYHRSTALDAARELLGKVLVTDLDGERTSAVILETEAYMGATDRASHAHGGKRTTRNETMYAVGGTVYVYLCYGIHHLFNVVVGAADLPHAVLIRAVHPVEGIATMQQRRPAAATSTGGPGTLTQALGIRTAHDGLDLLGDVIWIEDRGIHVPSEKIIVGPRIGVDYAGDDALLPYRFRIAYSQLEWK